MELMHGTGDNVVSLFCGHDPMSFPAIAQVDAYWEGLRAGRLMPARAEVDPRGLESALEFAFILEHIAPGVGRVRVAGMHLSDLLGMEVRGMPMTAFFAPDSRDQFSKILRSVVAEPQVADLTLTSPGGIGRPELTARLYLAPLASPDGGMPRVLGCLQSEGGIGRTPRRFDIEQVQKRRIVATMGAPDPEPMPAKPRVDPGFAESGTQFVLPAATENRRDRAKTTRGRPALTLVKSD